MGRPAVPAGSPLSERRIYGEVESELKREKAQGLCEAAECV